jgi:hypothetical protein
MIVTLNGMAKAWGQTGGAGVSWVEGNPRTAPKANRTRMRTEGIILQAIDEIQKVNLSMEDE